jgi:hypothetical protein
MFFFVLFYFSHFSEIVSVSSMLISDFFLNFATVCSSLGADLYCKNADGFTPFHLSVLYGKRKCAALLLEATLTAPINTFNTNANTSTSSSLFSRGDSYNNNTNSSSANNINDAEGKKEEEANMIDELFPYNPGLPLYTSTLGVISFLSDHLCFYSHEIYIYVSFYFAILFLL